MRHGEASFDAPTDPQRELTVLGQQQSRAMAEHYFADWQTVDLVLISPYVRTDQTWQQIAAILPQPVPVQILEELVPEADPEYASDVVIATAQVLGARRVLVVSHMPLLGYLLAELVPGQIPAMFTTSAVAKITLDEAATLVERLAPHELLPV
ncbi:phosphohistidine phosphatase SixA [Ferrimonas pelagia]|uniref:Phosphohistidine phosphatase SixA n=2 Tax=Ferrimonas pelagia TaxID=1177826 RepID=A0ABP9E8S8_9GAMM